MTYAELKAQIEFYAENNEAEWITKIPDFIRSAEADIWLFIQAPQNRFLDGPSTLTSGTDTISIATNNPMNIHSIAVSTNTSDNTGPWKILEYRDESYFDEAFPGPYVSGRTGDTPKYYTLTESVTAITTSNNTLTVRVVPAPVGDHKYRARYFGFPPSITSLGEDEESWISVIKSDALVYGGLYHGYIAMKADSGAALLNDYKGEYMRAVAELKSIAETKVTGDNFRPWEIPENTQGAS